MNAMCELFSKITSSASLIPSASTARCAGRASSYRPPVTSVGTWTSASRPVTSQSRRPRVQPAQVPPVELGDRPLVFGAEEVTARLVAVEHVAYRLIKPGPEL